MSRGVCSMDGCSKAIHAKGYCDTHYRRFKKHGNTDCPSREDNELILHVDYAEIKINNPKTGGITLVKVDIEDIEKLKGVRWYLSGKNQYARNDKRGMLHRYVLGVDSEIIVDHINGNPHDCRKANLRTCTISDNSKNKAISNNNMSGVTGVSFHKARQK